MILDLQDELTYYCETGEHLDHEDNGPFVYIDGAKTCAECFKSAAGRCPKCDELKDDDHVCMEVAA